MACRVSCEGPCPCRGPGLCEECDQRLLDELNRDEALSASLAEWERTSGPPWLHAEIPQWVKESIMEMERHGNVHVEDLKRRYL